MQVGMEQTAGRLGGKTRYVFAETGDHDAEERTKTWKEVTIQKILSEIAGKYIDDYEKVTGIRIKDSIEEISVATPATFARYFGVPNGTAYGYELSGWDGVMARSLSRGSELNIPGLAFCGGHSATGDGFGVSYESGIAAAEKAAADLKEADRGN